MAGKPKFDIAAELAAIVSKSDTISAPDVRMIPVADILPNPLNFYKIDKEALKSLMDSIAMDGLHHYPLVMPHPTEEGKWQIVDGERRYRAVKDEKKAQERKKAARKYQVPTQTHAQRVLRAIDAAGLTDDVKIPWERWDSYSVGTIRQWAEGNFEDSDDRWYSVRLTPESLYNAYKCCELLGCSADYLLGFTDELNPQKAESPAEGWLSLKWIDGRENPQTVGQRAVGQFIIDNRIDPVEEIVAWNGEQWLFDDYGVEVEGTCLWWFPIPGEDESWTD